MQLQAAFQGDLNALLNAEVRAAEKAVTTGVRTASDGLKTELRAQITSAGLGTRLANTWRGEVYPKGCLYKRLEWDARSARPNPQPRQWWC